MIVYMIISVTYNITNITISILIVILGCDVEGKVVVSYIINLMVFCLNAVENIVLVCLLILSLG